MTSPKQLTPLAQGLSAPSVAFESRQDAGQQLGQRLKALMLAPPVLVLGLPRGGVPVAAQVARWLRAPLDVVLVRKIGVPSQPELAADAVAEGDEAQKLVRQADEADARYAQAFAELSRRKQIYRAGRALPAVAGMTVVLVDDGLATGATMAAAIRAVRRGGPAHLVVAVPVGPPQALAWVRSLVDEVICLHQPPLFAAVGDHYRDFHQVGDGEVLACLRTAPRVQRPSGQTTEPRPGVSP